MKTYSIPFLFNKKERRETMEYIKKPVQIEMNSMEIIESELTTEINDPKKLAVVKRVIHTTADFEYADLLEFSDDAIDVAINELKNGAWIYSDTSMIISGVNKRNLSLFGGQVINFVHDHDVFDEAAIRGVTRSMVSIEKGAKDSRVSIFAIGNAPTAIFKLKEMIEEGKIEKPKLIIGVPVGFVGAAESKDLVPDLKVPYIIVRGRKGGSPVAAAIINAILLMAKEDL